MTKNVETQKKTENQKKLEQAKKLKGHLESYIDILNQLIEKNTKNNKDNDTSHKVSN